MGNQLAERMKPGIQSTDLLLRAGEPSDWPFIVASWLNNFRRESFFAARIKDDVFFRSHHGVVEDLVDRSKTLVACLTNDPDEILGYVVYEPGTSTWAGAVHWVYVKKAFRLWGIARRLLEGTGLPRDLAGVRVTHPTKIWFTTKQHGAGLEEKFPLAIHDPYAGLRP